MTKIRLLQKIVVVSFLLITALLANAEPEEPEVYFSTVNVRPGDFIQIRVKAADDALVMASFLDSNRPLLKTQACQFIGFLPVSYYNTPGEFQVAVMVKTPSLNWVKQYPIKVAERRFPESWIRIPESKQKEILTDANIESDNKIVATARLQALQNEAPPLWEGPFIWPVKGPISTGFGLIRYVNKTENGRHSGWDIVGSAGSPVVAANHGRVIFAGTLFQTGLTVIIYHGLDLFSSYAHLSVLKVKEGDLVQKGMEIGKVGSTGLSTGPHLHLTFRISEVSVDPALFLERQIGWGFGDTIATRQ